MNMHTIAQKTGDLPPMPQIAGELMQMMSKPDTTATQLERVMSRDPALTARVLKIANSAAYGLRTTVATVRQAISVLGLRTLNSLVLAGVTNSLTTSKRSSFKDKVLWEHSLCVGLASRQISRIEKYADPDTAFVGGLLHDIGKTVLDKNLGEEYEAVVMRVFNEGVTFVEAEREALGFDHSEVGSLVIMRWKLPATIEEVVRFHHEPGNAAIDRDLCAIVSFANSVCVKLGIGPERNPGLDLGQLPAAKTLGYDEARAAEVLESVEQGLAAENSGSM